MIRSRRAISIIELIVVLSASTVVLTLSSVLLQRVMRMHIQTRADQEAEWTSLRLSDQFRRDVHRARSVETERAELAGTAVLRLNVVDGQPIEYSYENGTLLRTTPKTGGRLAREEFAFPATSVVSIEQRGTPAHITLTVTSPQNGLHAEKQAPTRILTIPVSVHVEAALGRDQQLGSVPAAPEAQEK